MISVIIYFVMKSIILDTPDGFNLDTLYHRGTNSIGIVFCHGLSWYKEGEEPFLNAAQQLGKLGFSTLLFDFRGHGKSTGDSVKDFTLTGELTDINTAVTFLKEKGIKRIYLAGASFGAGAAIQYASAHINDIQRLFLANPTLEYERSIHKHFEPQKELLASKGYVETGSRKFRLGKKLFEELQHVVVPYKELEKYPHDLFIIHGDRDTRIPYKTSVEHFERLQNPKKQLSLILGADHGFHEEPFTTQATEQIVNFFSKL